MIAKEKNRTHYFFDGRKTTLVNDIDNDQITMPFPLIRRLLPTPQQIREHFKLSYFEVAREAGINPSIVYWIEHDIAVYPLEAQAVLSALSKHTHGKYTYTFNNVRGIRFRRVHHRNATRIRKW
jgi:hypothetical protein